MHRYVLLFGELADAHDLFLRKDEALTCVFEADEASGAEVDVGLQYQIR